MAADDALLVDTHLLFVLLIGSIDRNQVGKAKRTTEYSPEDYDLLNQELRKYRVLLLTPNILTEVSNLTGWLSEPLRTDVRRLLATTVTQHSEDYIKSTDAAAERGYLRLGLTDSSIVVAARKPATVITSDLQLYLELSDQDLTVLNFAHIRSARWHLE